MKIAFAIVLGIAILVLVNIGMMPVIKFLGFTVDDLYFWGLNIGLSLILFFWFVNLCADEMEEKVRQEAFEEALDEAKQEVKDDDDFGDDTSTDLPMFTDEASPREYKFGTIDLVFRGATAAEAAIMAIQFIDNEIFEDAMPEHRGPSSFGRPVNESAVRVVYRRVNDSYLASNDAKDQRESIEEAFEEIRLKLPDGRAWKITDNKYITWIPYNKFMFDMIILLDPMAGEPRKYHS